MGDDVQNPVASVMIDVDNSVDASDSESGAFADVAAFARMFTRIEREMSLNYLPLLNPPTPHLPPPTNQQQKRVLCPAHQQQQL